MTVERIHAIVNPKSSGGKTGKNWSDLENYLITKLGKFSHSFTEGRGDATKLAKEAAKNGAKQIIIIGGDGTVSEVINGIAPLKSGRDKITLSIFNQGTGGDFCRTLGIPSDPDLSVERILKGKDTKIDVGKIQYTTPNRQTETGYFANIAGCGMSGEVVQLVNSSSKRFGSFSYFLASTKILFAYKNKKIKVSLDGIERFSGPVVTLAICIGQFYGGGMQIAPQAQVADGKFDITVIGNWNLIQKLMYSGKLYNGTILDCPKVESFRATKVKVEPITSDEKAILECDGDDVGMAPLEAEVLPQWVQFRI